MLRGLLFVSIEIHLWKATGIFQKLHCSTSHSEHSNKPTISLLLSHSFLIVYKFWHLNLNIYFIIFCRSSYWHSLTSSSSKAAEIALELCPLFAFFWPGLSGNLLLLCMKLGAKKSKVKIFTWGCNKSPDILLELSQVLGAVNGGFLLAGDSLIAS